ncbi:reverse transcriptase (RNA-dependent DNA polymerase) domain-containing protein [Hirsutella rhossiliensis]|uniref:Reverse transcriptase (RNA-dependent DNA polymerase) domain-containing protein n=1 Tax=Hirsutella rhossiliensis TaxID=111463 RepID=A0A9P8MMB4_9HYPO|nr:reverse transcriptase (RNA-dependent DNA polymerase) domain-containing protein [Hirsutella rhossiliensis]KAH0957775.1 reverse transcriptase (RNA-dependent DNA polymerase) domain-containing protein [Hirsutella rhossiliensis]
MPEGRARPRLLFKNAPWNLIRARTDQLMRIVLEAIHELTPRARPSPYAKPRTQRRGGQPRPELERRAKEAAKEFHDAIRYQRKTHWDDFLSDDANIWKATKYLKAGKSTTGDKVPPLRKEDGSTTEDKADQADELLIAFFPPLPARIEDEGKPHKDDYTIAKAWRPISLLSTLGKILEAVVAERISYAVETYGLLPANHFGARKRRSEQALLLLQEQVYKAWRNHKVLSLISFDVKGAYNGVCKERLLERMKARGIPAELIRWIDAFCSGRTASLVVNGFASEQRELPQAGLPQGSPLSPILFLFFNADLVQRRIKAESGSIAFVDDYSAWVTGPTAEANREGIQAIIDDALEWEARSGATFETEKTTIVHFTRATILGVIMDNELRFQQHMVKAAAKGLSAAMGLRRLKMLSPRVSRQLLRQQSRQPWTMPLMSGHMPSVRNT